jgi:hypothetical protein
MRTQADRVENHAVRMALTQWLVSLRSTDWRRMSFFLGIPTVLTIYGATNDLHALGEDGAWLTFKFYIAHAYVPWWMTCLSTRLVYILLASYRPAAPILWVSGASLSCLLLIPYMGWIGMGIPTSINAQPEHMTLAHFLVFGSRVLLIWVLVNYLFERFAGLKLYRYTQPEESEIELSNIDESQAPVIDAVSVPVKLPEFLRKSGKVNAVEDLYSVSAEEHYVRIHTSSGDALIYKRFADAVKELDVMNGIRIHRSHWVSPYAISSVIRDGKTMYIKLQDGERLPVSRPYQAMVRSLADRCDQASSVAD